MFESRSIHHLDFVSRQLAFLLEDYDLDAALARLEAATPPQYEEDIRRLRGLLSRGAPEPDTLGASAYGSLKALMQAVGSQRTRLFRKFIDYLEQSRATFQTFSVGFGGLLAYVLGVLAFALVVATLFIQFVLPGFATMYSNMGASLPHISEALFQISNPGAFAFIAVSALFVLLIAGYFLFVWRRTQQLAPLPRTPAWLPLVGAFTHAYNLGLFLNFTRMLLACGVDPSPAVRTAAEASNQPRDVTFDALKDSSGFDGSAVLGELAVAARIGNFASELDSQCDMHVARLVSALLRLRNRWSIALKLLAFLLVGTLVFAMYLPIFRLGSVL